MKTNLVFLFLLFFVLNSVFSADKVNLNRKSIVIKPCRPAHLVPIYAADTRAHRLSLQRSFNSSEYIGSMGGQFSLYNLEKGRHKFQFELAGTTYLGLLRSINHGSVINTDYFVDVFLNYQFNRNWAVRFGTGHTSQHLSDDAIVNANYQFRNYARDYHQIGVSYIGERNKFHFYNNFIYNYNFKTDTDISGKLTIQPGFELNINQVFFKQENPSGFSIGVDAKFRGELNYKSTRNLQFAYQFAHVQPQKLKLVLNFTGGADERGQFYESSRSLIRAGIYAEY